MISSSTMNRVRYYTPIVAITTAVTTLVTCVIITKVKNVYVSGLVWPFFSDMGRDPPAYYVFCVGLTIVGFLLACTWVFNYQFQSALLRSVLLSGMSKPYKLMRMCRFVCFAGTISTIGLPLLAIYDTSTYLTFHMAAAYWFFAWEVFAICCNTYLSKQLYQFARHNERVGDAVYSEMEVENKANAQSNASHSVHRRHRTYKVQMIFMVLFSIAFTVYIPLGMIFQGYSPRLTVQECLDRDLGHKYCTETMRWNEVETKLFNSEKNFARAQSRACGQLGCILTLMGYSISFLWHEYEASQQTEITEQ